MHTIKEAFNGEDEFIIVRVNVAMAKIINVIPFVILWFTKPVFYVKL